MNRYDILNIQERSDNARKAGRRVVNGCAGMLFRDDSSLCTYDTVNEVISKRFSSYLAYPAVLGSSEYANGVKNWVFGESLPEYEDKYQMPFSVTLGGTGAIAVFFSWIKELHGEIIISDTHWPNYETIAYQAEIEIHRHNMFTKERTYDFESLKAGIDEILEHSPIAGVVINDPCQNPLGYCFSKEEYVALIDLLNSYHGRAYLLMDIAYIDYADTFPLLDDKMLLGDISFPVYFAFSCSKSFGLYGMRLGALFALYRKDKDLSNFTSFMNRYARGTYSCANNGAMGPMSEFFNDPELTKTTKEAIHVEKERLLTIGRKTAEVLDELGIDHYPYKGGFYLTCMAEDAYALVDRLEEKDIYFAPIAKDKVRIAVSGLTLEDIEEFHRRMK